MSSSCSSLLLLGFLDLFPPPRLVRARYFSRRISAAGSEHSVDDEIKNNERESAIRSGRREDESRQDERERWKEEGKVNGKLTLTPSSMLLQDGIVVVSEFILVLVIVVLLALVASSFSGSSSVRLGFGGEVVVVVGL